MDCLLEETMKWISHDDWTWLEYNLGGWNVGQHTPASQQWLGLKVVEQLRSGVCRSVNRLCIKNANHINIGVNQIEN